MTDTILKALSKFRIVVASDPAQLAALNPVITVEAEYGDTLVEGKALTLAHHGSRASQPAPCIAEVPRGILENLEGVIGLSHVDLDSLGGLIRLAGGMGPEAFWKLAAHVDVHGPHQALVVTNENSTEMTQLYAWWATSAEDRFQPAKDGSPTDAMEWVSRSITALWEIFMGDAKRLEAGKEFRKGEDKLNRESFVELRDGVLVRVAPTFTNHLYLTPDGKMGQMVITLNQVTGAIIASREGDSVPVDCRELVQSLWGDEAGGRSGIAGSPRNRRMDLDDLVRAAHAARLFLRH